MIALVLENFTVALLAAGLAAGLVLGLVRGRDVPHRWSEPLLAAFLFFSVGVSYAYNFVMHVIFGDMTAEFIGWAQSPFQAEVGWASLGFALVGLYAAFASFGARLAAIVGPGVFMWGAAGGHVYQMMKAQNFAPGNAGSILYMDILFALFGLGFLAWRYRGEGRGAVFAPAAGRR